MKGMMFWISKGLSAVLAITVLALFSAVAHAVNGKNESGKDIVLDRAKGNCLSCHSIPGLGADNVLPGNVGPELKNIKHKFSNEKTLHDHIWDEMKFNPNTAMPPFGKHHILNDDEINKVTDFMWNL